MPISEEAREAAEAELGRHAAIGTYVQAAMNAAAAGDQADNGGAGQNRTMNISVGNSVQITTGRDCEKAESFLNVHQVLSGYGFSLELYGRFVLCRHIGLPVPVIVATPSPKWDQDLIDEGYEIIEVIGFKSADNAASHRANHARPFGQTASINTAELELANQTKPKINL